MVVGERGQSLIQLHVCVCVGLFNVCIAAFNAACFKFIFLIACENSCFFEVLFFFGIYHHHHRTHQRRTGVPFVATKVKQLNPMYSLNSTQQTHTEMYECVRINSANLNSAAISVTQTNSTAVSQ